MKTLNNIGNDCLSRIVFFASKFPENWFSLRLVNKFWYEKSISIQNINNYMNYFTKLNIRKRNEKWLLNMHNNSHFIESIDYDIMNYSTLECSNIDIFRTVKRYFNSNRSINNFNDIYLPYKLILDNLFIERKDIEVWLSYLFNNCSKNFIKEYNTLFYNLLESSLNIKLIKISLENNCFVLNPQLLFNDLCNRYKFENIPSEILSYLIEKHKIHIECTFEQLLSINIEIYKEILYSKTIKIEKMDLNLLKIKQLYMHYPNHINILITIFINRGNWNCINKIIEIEIIDFSMLDNYLLCYSFISCNKKWISTLLKNNYILKLLQENEYIHLLKNKYQFNLITELHKKNKKQSLEILGFILCFCFKNKELVTIKTLQLTKIFSRNDFQDLDTIENIYNLINYYNKKI